MTTAKNIGRIDVWPDWRTAAAADTEESKVIQKLTVWGTTARARANLDHEDEGGGETYTAQAVRFDGSSWLSINSLVATDNEFMSFVFWEKIAEDDSSSNAIYVSDYNNYVNFMQGGTNTFNLRAGEGAAVGGPTIDASGFPFGQWNCVIVSFNTQLAIGKVYRGDVDVTDIWTGEDEFTSPINGRSFFFGGDGDAGTIGDFADVRFMPGVSLLDGGNDIPEVTRRLFIDANGKPVDPATATAALGTPRILFTGNAASFATNQGSGGAFTLTGSLNNAASSPSD